MTELKQGCCSAALPCNFQKEFPNSICAVCTIAKLRAALILARAWVPHPKPEHNWPDLVKVNKAISEALE